MVLVVFKALRNSEQKQIKPQVSVSKYAIAIIVINTHNYLHLVIASYVRTVNLP